MKKLLFLWEELKTSFWFVPALIIAAAIALAIGFLYLDNLIHFQPSGIIQYIFTGSTDSARAVLSTISGAMIGVAGTVFSITLVALTLASSQFGSRLLRNFMHERLNQVVLGTYISTYVYCLIVLNTVKETDQVSFIPTFSVFVAILAAVANIVLLIIFIHHIAISIQADKVISDISVSLSKNINALFPEEMGEEPEPKAAPEVEVLKAKFRYRQSVKASRSGYLQYIDQEGIFDKANEMDWFISLHFRPGDFLVKDLEIATIHSHEKHEEKVLERLADNFIIGDVRTPQQDAEFSIHQMVEIAARALSPGVNDPYTAIACIDNLTSTMCYLTKVKFPSRYRYDEKENLRVMVEALTFEGMLNAAFNQIRQFAKGSPSVVIRLMEALITIHRFARNHEQKRAVQTHAEMVLRLAENSFEEKNDLEDMRKRSKQIIEEN